MPIGVSMERFFHTPFELKELRNLRARRFGVSPSPLNWRRKLRPREGPLRSTTEGSIPALGSASVWRISQRGVFCNWVFCGDADDFFVVLVGIALRARIAVTGVRESVGDGDGLFDFGVFFFLVVLVGLEVQHLLCQIFDDLFKV